MSLPQEINEKIKEVLSAEKCLFRIPIDWYKQAVSMLRKRSPISLGLSIQEFEDLYNLLRKNEVPTYYVFAAVNNMLEDLVFGDSTFATFENYIAFQHLVKDLSGSWNDETMLLRESAIKEIQKKYDSKLKTPLKAINE